jgi:hypothetical protein
MGLFNIFSDNNRKWVNEMAKAETLMNDLGKYQENVKTAKGFENFE